MRFSFFVLLCAAIQLSAEQLRVVSATAKAVELQWAGPGGNLERAEGASFVAVPSATGGHFVDTKVAPFATYKYRVSSGGKFSNVVTVGPPPGGAQNIAGLSKGVDPGTFGATSAIALDENGDPVVAFDWSDPNGDGDRSDAEIRFVRWNRASYSWMPSTRVATVGDIPDKYVNSIALACDRDSGLLAAVTPVHEKGAVYLVSTDHGTTWKSTPITEVTSTLYSAALRIAGGQVHVALNTEEGALFLGGAAADAGSWKTQAIRADSGWKVQNGTNVSLALDPSGKPVVAYYQNQDDASFGYGVWRPDSNGVTVVKSKASSDFPHVAIASGAGKLGLLLAMQLDEKDDSHAVWYTQSSGGGWSTPSKLPVDGPRSTNAPLDLAIDSRGGIVAVFGSNSGSESAVCNFPALSRSRDGVAWKTCGPGKAEGGDFSPQPPTLHAIEAANDKVYVLWSEQTDNKFGQGILLWHER